MFEILMHYAYYMWSEAGNPTRSWCLGLAIHSGFIRPPLPVWGEPLLVVCVPSCFVGAERGFFGPLNVCFSAFHMPFIFLKKDMSDFDCGKSIWPSNLHQRVGVYAHKKTMILCQVECRRIPSGLWYFVPYSNGMSWFAVTPGLISSCPPLADLTPFLALHK